MDTKDRTFFAKKWGVGEMVGWWGFHRSAQASLREYAGVAPWPVIQ